MWDELQERKYLVIKDFLDPARAATLGEEFQDWCEKGRDGKSKLPGCKSGLGRF